MVGVKPMRLDQQLAKPGPWWASVLQRCRQKAGQQLKVVAWLWEVDRGISTKWQPTPVFLPGESQGRGSLVG